MTTELALSAKGQIVLTASPEGLRLSSPYDPAFVAAFKIAIPQNGRRWDGQARQWLIDPKHGPALVREIEVFFGVSIELPKSDKIAAVPVTELVSLAYLGACKDREDGSTSASGYLLGNRNPKAPDLLVAEDVLKTWFERVPESANATPALRGSLYSLLCVAPDADASTIKTAYRKMARQTHPDVNKEPDAAQQFHKIQEAYDVLSDAKQRRKYDAGLMLEVRAKAEQSGTYRHDGLFAPRPFVGSISAVGDWRAPLRCGLLLVTGTRQLGRLNITTIHSWEELTRNGQALVSSWPKDATVWLESWIAL